MTKSHLLQVVLTLAVTIASITMNAPQSCATQLTVYNVSAYATDRHRNLTSIMEKPIPGKTCAVSRNLKHLLGKEIYIEGVGIRRVNDLTNRRFKNRVDICMAKTSSANRFGVVRRTMTVL